MPKLPPLTIFDVETTGLDPQKGHRIIEIAGVRIEDGKLDETKTFVSLVNPERPIPWEAKQIHRIADEEVAGAPTIDQVLPQFLEFASGSILFAHNAQFDMGFLEREKEFCWGYIDLPECFCTMKLSQALFPTEFNHSLDNVCRRLNIAMPANRHRALPDVLLTAQALLKFSEKFGVYSLEHFREKASFRKTARK